jgi:hypothetical protein
MSAPLLIKVQSATFAGVPIVGATNASVELGGSEQTARGDGAIAAQIAYVEDIKGKVTVNALQSAITNTTLILPGAGALVIVGFTQAAGAGALGGGGHTWTFPNATLNSTTRGLPLDGNPTNNLNFTCVDPNGVPSSIFSVT